MTSSGVSQYLEELSRYPILTKEAQLRHSYRVAEWKNYPEGPEKAPLSVRRAGQRSLDALVRTNLRLVVSLAKKFVNRGLDLEDLIQEGNLGLIRGIEMYDPTRGYALSTYCFWWIKQGLTRAIYNQGRTIRMPVNALEQLQRVERFIDNYRNTHGFPPTLEHIAENLAMGRDKIQGLLQARLVTSTLSFDVPVATGFGEVSSNNLVEVLSSPEDENPMERLSRQEYERWLDHALCQLKPKEAYIIRRVEIEGSTIVAASDELGISRSRGTQILHKALRQVKIILLLDGFSF